MKYVLKCIKHHPSRQMYICFNLRQLKVYELITLCVNQLSECICSGSLILMYKVNINYFSSFSI